MIFMHVYKLHVYSIYIYMYVFFDPIFAWLQPHPWIEAHVLAWLFLDDLQQISVFAG